MKAGEYKITVEGVEGVLCEARVNLASIMLRRDDAEPVSLAIEDTRALELVTVLSIVAGGCESVVWRQHREESERKAAELRAMESLRPRHATVIADKVVKAGDLVFRSTTPTCAVNEEGRHECCE